VDQDGGPSLFDRDLDPPQRRPVVLRDEIRLHQRVIVNPLLAVVFWLADAFLLRMAYSLRDLAAFLGYLAVLILPFFVIQFHCLDCGTTGWYSRVHNHACSAVVARRAGRLARPWFPAPDVQFRVWFGVVVLAILLYAILAR
jgi:hypothetical protein